VTGWGEGIPSVSLNGAFLTQCIPFVKIHCVLCLSTCAFFYVKVILPLKFKSPYLYLYLVAWWYSKKVSV
jgi:hypothetical protein